jgi:single-stranded-DNA-specific exonuclease
MKWINKIADAEAVRTLAAALVADRLVTDAPQANTLARLLVMRGVEDNESAQRFLSPTLEHLHSPYLMLGMKAAVDRIDAAIESKEGILIYGDYDVDGTTAVVILKTAIELCGGAAEFHVPHRIKEGYDLREDVIERSAAAGIKLVVSVDTGIRAFAAAETAHRLGVDLIVTDHHLPGPDGMPRALAVLNPNQVDCEYPCKLLCGAGVAFKLAQALMQRRMVGKDQAKLNSSFLKIVAIATIADAVPLNGENRVFAKLGLEALRLAVNPGLKALLDVAKLGGRPLTSGEVGFRIAPRINAAGRMDVARDVIDLFSSKDPVQAVEIAQKLDALNSARQQEEREIMESICKRFESEPALQEAFCVVVDGEGWHRGVIGITATRVVERFGRPALVISRDGDEAHGSARSIPAFHLLNALESCASIFTRFGGHAHAAGFSLPAERIPELRAKLDVYARERLTLADFQPALNYDAELPLEHVTPRFFNLLQRLEPFGAGNPEPTFIATGVRVLSPPRLLKEKHVKLKLSAAVNGKSIVHSALGWHMAERIKDDSLIPGDRLDIAYTLDYNDHPDFGGVELSLRDYKRHPEESNPIK